MQILLELEHFKASGSTQYFYQLYKSMKDADIDVTVTSPKPEGLFFELFGSDVYLGGFRHFNVVITNHYSCIKHFENSSNIADMKIFSPQISYIFDGSEFGDKMAMNREWLDWADEIVTISKESFDVLSNMGYKSTIINQPVHLKTFEHSERPNTKTVLSCVRGPIAKSKIKDICRMNYYNLTELSIFDYNFTNDGTTSDVSNQIKNADVVIGVGRIVYESIAMGRPVIVYDERKYQPSYSDGLVTSLHDFLLYNYSNCSGRMRKLALDGRDIDKYIKEAFLLNFDWTKEARKYMDSDIALEKYLNLINEKNE